MLCVPPAYLPSNKPPPIAAANNEPQLKKTCLFTLEYFQHSTKNEINKKKHITNLSTI